MGAACSLACVCCVQKRNQRMFASVEDRQRKTRGAVEQTELERAYEQGFEAGVVEGYKRGTAESLRASPASVRSVDASQIAGGGPGRLGSSTQEELMEVPEEMPSGAAYDDLPALVLPSAEEDAAIVEEEPELSANDWTKSSVLNEYEGNDAAAETSAGWEDGVARAEEEL
jgi:hypothetical protein